MQAHEPSRRNAFSVKITEPSSGTPSTGRARPSTECIPPSRLAMIPRNRDGTWLVLPKRPPEQDFCPQTKRDGSIAESGRAVVFTGPRATPRLCPARPIQSRVTSAPNCRRSGSFCGRGQDQAEGVSKLGYGTARNNTISQSGFSLYTSMPIWPQMGVTEKFHTVYLS